MNEHSLLKIQWVGLQTIVRKEVIRIFRIWMQTLLPSVITTSLYFLIFGGFIGSRIGKLHGVSYIAFIVPGLIMMSVITNAYSNVSSSFFGAKFQKNIEEMLVSPLASALIVLGYVVGGVVRGCLVGVLVTAVSLFFVPLQVHHWGIMVGTIVLSAVLFSVAGFLNGLYARKFDDVAIVPTFVLSPLTYLGGVFYSIQSLPDFWRNVSFFNPIVYLINLFRFGFLGISDVPVGAAFLGLSVGVVAMFVWVLVLMKRGVGIQS